MRLSRAFFGWSDHMNESISLPPIPSALRSRRSLPPPPALPADILFTGRRSDFTASGGARCVARARHLGFYRFWLATDIRRHLWSHTSVNGDAPEYTGTRRSC
jgi:hypothetical protein